MGCGIYATREDNHFIFPHHFSSSDYLFIYAAGSNNSVGLIHPTPYSAYTPEVYIEYEDVVDTMGDYMMDATEHKMERSVMTLIISVGRKMKLMMKLTLCMIPLKKIADIKKYASLNQPMAQNIL